MGEHGKFYSSNSHQEEKCDVREPVKRVSNELSKETFGTPVRIGTLMSRCRLACHGPSGSPPARPLPRRETADGASSGVPCHWPACLRISHSPRAPAHSPRSRRPTSKRPRESLRSLQAPHQTPPLS